MIGSSGTESTPLFIVILSAMGDKLPKSPDWARTARTGPKSLVTRRCVRHRCVMRRRRRRIWTLLGLSCAAAYAWLLWLGRSYGSTAAERRSDLPGDDIVAHPQ